MCIAIEMKIDARDQDKQLIRYEQYAKKKAGAYRVCYLTLRGSSPSEQSAQGLNEENFRNLSFSGHILRWLMACLEETPVSSSAYSFIQQYQKLIKKMTGEESMSEQISALIQGADPVSYTHLDVYKRQSHESSPPATILPTVLQQGPGAFLPLPLWLWR